MSAFVSGFGGSTCSARKSAIVCSSQGSQGSESARVTRRDLLVGIAAASVLAVAPVAYAAEEVAAPEKPAPVFDFKLSGDYKKDASQVVTNMRGVTGMARGTPGMAEDVASTRKNMNDFVALYRRNGNVSGSISFSTLYTAINTLSGHFQSYGNSYPVPEKRRKRLNAQYNDIEKALSRGR
mmetsp:Transcript_10298/g.18559  ORF Transcript_10298/g.18559 Transcript_10298/m.18559 type:complete len:181 (-) Transcript_10298:1604-2146(-)